MFSLELPHRGNSNEYTQYTIFSIKRKITLNYPNWAAMGFFPRDSRTLPTELRATWSTFGIPPAISSHGKRAISVRATEVLLYFQYKFHLLKSSCDLENE